MFKKIPQPILALSGLLVLTAFALTACSPTTAPTAPAAVASQVSNSATTPAVVPPVENKPAAANGSAVVLKTAQNEQLGTFLVADQGMTLYLFTKDTPGKSNCTGNCLVQWPPFVATALNQIQVESGVDAAKLGLADLPDGQKIVTYKGMPLYYWFKDQKPGDVTGQNVGNVWFVVAP